MAKTNRERALDAAIALLATGGVRALTHRQVDLRAGLPDGSTSNYFRTRSALFQGVTEYMVTVELPVVADSTRQPSPREFIDGLVDLYGFLTGPNRQMTAARLALFVEAGHDDELRALLAGGRRQFIVRLRSQFVALGAPDPDRATQLLAVCFEGLFLHEIAGHANVDAASVLDAAVRASLP
ncbi:MULTISPECIES: TetR/AcrR family transcriptional regulator [unclassified Leifsonia]|uniref:TetR/AcrR family transcriptional regulator n=1 Tax=unclassified Leifsonia TaxID=2663824 RepID=UPI0007012BFE|nr:MULTISPECIES: TetR family transcriptional regulator C-terminal domain-containing protein [unclassified Leifsonia]KQX07647.1 hypothetical protein ASC59_07915 [Leifsonia sp. Root1293]KRA11929.1 hypothetical protein ASD61_07915 [Leifsonia sp. Root60]